jgi:hypothetical protein
MTPQTVHLVRTLIRHARGMVNAIEKFERTVPRDERAREITTLITFGRAAMAAAEETLSDAPGALTD